MKKIDSQLLKSLSRFCLTMALLIMGITGKGAISYNTNIVTNGSATLGNLTGWDVSSGPNFAEFDFGTSSPDGGGVFELYIQPAAPQWISQTIDVSSLSSDILAGIVKADLSVYMLNYHNTSANVCRIKIEQLDASNAVVATSQVDDNDYSIAYNPYAWVQRTITLDNLNTNTRKLRITLYSEINDTYDTSSFIEFDGISLKLNKLSTVTTQDASSVGSYTATGNGNITNMGTVNPTAHGICWNTTGSPTIVDSKVDNGAASAAGAFTADITGLTANTTYHVRAFATTTGSTRYGEEVTFTTLATGTWTGAVSRSWGEPLNWSDQTIPTATTDVVIPEGTANFPMIEDSADCHNLTAANGKLRITSGYWRKESLIVHGTATGTVFYINSDLAINQWHIVSIPVTGEDIGSFVFTNSALAKKDVNGTTNYAMTDYNEAGNAWNSYFTHATPGTFTPGEGYSMRLAINQYIMFEGELITGTKNVSLTKAGEGWNCIGNPYTSAIGMNASATSAENFLTKNSSILDANYACVYIWDGASSSYKILGNLPSGLVGARSLTKNYVQLGQAFFVKAKAASQVTFTPAMQSHQDKNTAPLLKSAKASWPIIQLNVAAGTTTASTVVAFNSDMTKGLDPTYDAGLLRGTTGVNLYSRLVDDNGVDFAIQALPSAEENVVIPIGVESKEGGSITFSAKTQELPTNTSVVLEDKTTGTLTPLTDSTSTYTATVDAGTKGIGRFYLITKSATTTTGISTDEATTVSAYASNKTITINGKLAGATAQLFDINGKQVDVKKLSADNVSTLEESKLVDGVYVLRVISVGKVYSFKVVLQ